MVYTTLQFVGIMIIAWLIMYIYSSYVHTCIWGDFDDVIDEDGMVVGPPTDPPPRYHLHVMQGVWGWGRGWGLWSSYTLATGTQPNDSFKELCLIHFPR